MLIEDIISAGLARLHDKSTGILFWFTKLSQNFNVALSQMALHMGHIGQDLHAC